MNDITEMIEVWLFLNRWQHPDPDMLSVGSLKEGQLTISPNPSNGVFKIELPASADFTIHTMNGTLLQTGTLDKGTQQVDLSGQPQGIYLFTVGETIYKLAKQ